MFYQLRDYSPVDQSFLRNPAGKLKKKRSSLVKVNVISLYFTTYQR